jgi:hypothetical protein
MAGRWLTYADAGALLGMTPEAVRQRARRHGWSTRKTGNKPNDPNEVLVPDNLPVHPVGQPTGRPPDQPPGQPGDAATVVDTMAALLADRRAAEAERDAARAEAEEARQQAQQERERTARAEGEAAGLREGLRVAEAARDTEAVARRDAEARERRRADAERQGREAAERKLAEWTAGGPLARAWRALVYQRR